MPEENYTWFPHEQILQFEECCQLVDVFTGLGVDKVRLTGGEPLLRRDLHILVRQLAQKAAIKDLALTTNGLLLAERVEELSAAGLGRLTISLDTLRHDRFFTLSRSKKLDQVMEGIEETKKTSLAASLKIDTVAMRGVNDDEFIDLIEFGGEHGAEVRFIEFMDVGGATTWSKDKVVTRAEMLRTFEKHYGAIEAVPKKDSAPADQYCLPDGRIFGIISSTTQPFCGNCDRSRLTADGKWFLCLYASTGIDLRAPLREGASTEELQAIIGQAWGSRDDRGAEERLTLKERGRLASASDMRKNPHLEMHTRGG